MGLERVTEPGEEILESSEGGRDAVVQQTKERNPPGKTHFKAGPSCKQTSCGYSSASATQGRFSQSGA